MHILNHNVFIKKTTYFVDLFPDAYFGCHVSVPLTAVLCSEGQPLAYRCPDTCSGHNFDGIAFGVQYHTFVIAVAGGPWFSGDAIVIGTQALGKRIHGRRAAHPNGNMGVALAAAPAGRRSGDTASVHEFQPRTPISECQEIGTESFARIGILRTARRTKVGRVKLAIISRSSTQIARCSILIAIRY